MNDLDTGLVLGMVFGAIFAAVAVWQLRGFKWVPNKKREAIKQRMRDKFFPLKIYFTTVNGITAALFEYDYKAAKAETLSRVSDGRWPADRGLCPRNGTYLFWNQEGKDRIDAFAEGLRLERRAQRKNNQLLEHVTSDSERMNQVLRRGTMLILKQYVAWRSMLDEISRQQGIRVVEVADIFVPFSEPAPYSVTMSAIENNENPFKDFIVNAEFLPLEIQLRLDAFEKELIAAMATRRL